MVVPFEAYGVLQGGNEVNWVGGCAQLSTFRRVGRACLELMPRCA